MEKREAAETAEAAESAEAPETAEAAAEEADIISAPSISAEEFPVTDGSTATLPLSWMLYRLCTGESQEAAESALSFTKTNNAYVRLMDKEADLVIAYEPGPNAKADERYDDLEMKPIGLDALIFICNTANPVESLTTRQIREIYTGKITNWKDVGGEDSEIIAFQREVNSGSQTLMENLMMQGLEMAPAPIEYRPSEMGDLIEGVARYANSGNALGYSVYFYAKNMYAKPNLRFMAVDGVMPSNDAIRSGEYRYTNPFYAAVRKDEPKDSKAYELFEWLTSDDGQSLIEEMDYVSIEKGTKKLPEELVAKTSLLEPVLEGNTHRLAVNGQTYDGDAGVVILDENGQFLLRRDDIRIRDNDEYALIRGSVFPACRPAFAKSKPAPYQGENGESITNYEEGAYDNIPIGLFDVDKNDWAVEPVYDYCYTECHDGDHAIFYMGNWWSHYGFDENWEYVYIEEPEADMFLYDENGEALGKKTFSGYEGNEELISGTLLRRHMDAEYDEAASRTTYPLGPDSSFITEWKDNGTAWLILRGEEIARGSDGYVLPYMSDFISEDMIPEGWYVVHLYDSGVDEKGEYYYHDAGQYVIDRDAELRYILNNSEDESIELVDEHFLVIGNYKSGKQRIIDYEGNEAASWITPYDYEYANW